MTPQVSGMAVPQGLARYRQEGNVWTGQGHATTQRPVDSEVCRRLGMGAHRDGRLCYLERRNHAIALALYRAAETTATRALRERAGRPLVRLVLVRSGHVALNRRGTCFQWNGTLWATWSGRSGRHPRPARRGVARRRARALGLETLPALGVPDSFDQLLRWLQGGC